VSMRTTYYWFPYLEFGDAILVRILEVGRDGHAPHLCMPVGVGL
jgi:hypothetical protein